MTAIKFVGGCYKTASNHYCVSVTARHGSREPDCGVPSMLRPPLDELDTTQWISES